VIDHCLLSGTSFSKSIINLSIIHDPDYLCDRSIVPRLSVNAQLIGFTGGVHSFVG
jgi:hypothetical protein